MGVIFFGQDTWTCAFKKKKTDTKFTTERGHQHVWEKSCESIYLDTNFGDKREVILSLDQKSEFLITILR